MSMEQTAYMERASVPDRAALQAAVDALGFDCQVDEYYVPFECSGCLPCMLNGQLTGPEIYFEETSECLKQFPHRAEVVGSRDVAVTFRWGARFSESACVCILCAAFAQSCGAIVQYVDDDILYSADELFAEAHSALEELVKNPEPDPEDDPPPPAAPHRPPSGLGGWLRGLFGGGRE